MSSACGCCSPHARCRPTTHTASPKLRSHRRNWFHWANIGGLAGLVPSGGSTGEPVSCTPPPPGGCLSLGSGPPTFKAGAVASSAAPRSSLRSCPVVTGTPRAAQNRLPPRSLCLYRVCTVPFCRKVSHSQASGMRMETSLGDPYSVYHGPLWKAVALSHAVRPRGQRGLVLSWEAGHWDLFSGI